MNRKIYIPYSEVVTISAGESQKQIEIQGINGQAIEGYITKALDELDDGAYASIVFSNNQKVVMSSTPQFISDGNCKGHLNDFNTALNVPKPARITTEVILSEALEAGKTYRLLVTVMCVKEVYNASQNTCN